MRLILAVAALFAFMSCANAATFSSLEERMSQSEFHAAGLDKLSPEELKNLDSWLRTHFTTGTTYVTAAGSPVFYPKQSERQAVESHIVGKFNGWYGQTVITLDNGQQWTQAESGSSVCGPINHPTVKIKPMLIGSWLAYVQSCRDSVRVDRTK